MEMKCKLFWVNLSSSSCELMNVKLEQNVRVSWVVIACQYHNFSLHSSCINLNHKVATMFQTLLRPLSIIKQNTKLKRDKFLINFYPWISRESLSTVSLNPSAFTLRASIQFTSPLALNACRLRRHFCCPSSQLL